MDQRPSRLPEAIGGGALMIGFSVAFVLPAHLGRAWVFQWALIIYGLLVFGSLLLIFLRGYYLHHYVPFVITLIMIEGLFGAYMGLVPSDREHVQVHLAGMLPLFALWYVGYGLISRRLDLQSRPDDAAESTD
jgi:hypothetical protein